MGLSQNKDFGALMGNYASVDIGTEAIPKVVQYQRTAIGPIECLAFGLNLELSFSGDEMNEILNRISRISSGITIVYINSITPATVRGTVPVKIRTLVLDLTKEIHPKGTRRHSIRLAAKRGVVVSEATPGDLQSCFKICTEFAALKHAGNPSGEISKLFGSPFAKLLVAKRGDRTLGFIFLLLDRSLGKVNAEQGRWNLEGVDCNVPSLLIWEAIQWSKKAGFKYFDFLGYSSVNERYANIARFKRSFGGETKEFFRYRTVFVLGKRAPLLMFIGAKAIDLEIWPVTAIATNLFARRAE